MIQFSPVADGDNTEPGPHPSEFECQCTNPDDRYLLGVDEGAASVIHVACGKPPAFEYDYLSMASMPVRLSWVKQGRCWCDGICDCDQYANLLPEPPEAQLEQARRIAVALEQENARLRELLGTVAGRWAEIAEGMRVLSQAADPGDPLGLARADRARVLHTVARDVRWVLACDSLPHDLRTSEELGELTAPDGAS